MQEEWAVVYPGGDFPGGAVRACGRGLKCADGATGDAYVALWIRSDGEAVFGRAWAEDAKMKASFAYDGREVTEAETGGIRILVAPLDAPPYKWVPAKEVNPAELVYSGACLSAVVTRGDGSESLGRANLDQHQAWTCADGKNYDKTLSYSHLLTHVGLRFEECVHAAEEYENCLLLCKTGGAAPPAPTGVPADGPLATAPPPDQQTQAPPQPQEEWAVVYPGGEFPGGAVRACGRGLKCADGATGDAYVALWIRPNGEAVFGRAWAEDAKMKASFAYDGREVTEQETGGIRILVAPLDAPPYRWCAAKEVNPCDLVYSGACLSAVVTRGDGSESLGRANLDQHQAWTCADGKEVAHGGEEYDNCLLLCKNCAPAPAPPPPAPET